MSQVSAGRVARKLSDEDILSPFKMQIEPVKVSAWYQLGLAVVGILMILLPAVYLAMIGLVGYGVYYHATHAGWIGGLDHGRGGMRAMVIMYLAPLFAGVVLIVSMVKPLLARSPKQGKPIELDEEKEPLLFEFVDCVAQTLGAPMPRRICVDCDINASAGFRRGLLSFFGNDLVLTLGMPLVAGLSGRQLAGVLAHELGHFTQGVGMRFSYLIRVINVWFARVVYQRDTWDEHLRRWQEAAGVYSLAIILPARGMVWITRRVLWALMHLGHIMSCFLLRQMEYDADHHAAVLVGSEMTASTGTGTVILSIAYRGAQQDLSASFKERRLADDLPELIQANVGQMPADVHEKILKSMAEEKTGVFDTHPCHRDRVRSVTAQNEPGIFQLELPARRLFRDYAGLCRITTQRYYREVLGEDASKLSLVATQEVVKQQEGIQQEQKRAHRYFQGLLCPACPLLLQGYPSSIDGETQPVIDALMEARSAMQTGYDAAKAAVTAYDAADSQILDITYNMALLEAGFKCVNGENGVKHTKSSQTALYQQVAASMAQARHGVMTYLELARQRLMSALSLLYSDQAELGMADLASVRATCRRSLETLHRIAEWFQTMLNLRSEQAGLMALMRNIKGNENNAALINRIKAKLADLRKSLLTLQGELRSVEYPFDHAGGRMTLMEHALEKVAPVDDLAVLEQCEEAMQRLMALYFRCMGTLTSTAERVEEAIGLPPLADPPKEEPKPSHQSTSGR